MPKKTLEKEIKNFWVSWYCPISQSFTLNFPWWISGYCYDKEDNEIDMICAAIRSDNEENAMEIIKSCYDEYQNNIEFRFICIRDKDWSPFCDRFQKFEWMKWE